MPSVGPLVACGCTCTTETTGKIGESIGPVNLSWSIHVGVAC